MQGKWIVGVLALIVILETGYVITQLNNGNTTLGQSASTGERSMATCDVSSLCLKESKNEGGIFGVAEVTAHNVGKKSFNVMSDIETCSMMAIDTANDPRVLEEIGASPDGQYLFAIPESDVIRYDGTTSDSAASLIIYITERVGRDTGPCSERVRILN